MKTAAAISWQQLQDAFHKDKSAVDHKTLELVRLIVRNVVSNMKLAPDAPEVLDIRAHVDAELLLYVREDWVPEDDRVTYAPWIVMFARWRVLEELRRRERLVVTRRHLATALKN